jgi:HD-GYP domain-containing protein (c-di-GMP phosphodiesterase class II)
MVVILRIVCIVLLLYQLVLFFSTLRDTSELGHNTAGIQVCTALSAFFLLLFDFFANLRFISTSVLQWAASLSAAAYIGFYFFLLRFVLSLLQVDKKRMKIISLCLAVLTAAVSTLFITNPVTLWIFTVSCDPAEGTVILSFSKNVPFFIYLIYSITVLVICILVLAAKCIQNAFRYSSRYIYMSFIILAATVEVFLISRLTRIEKIWFVLPDIMLLLSILMYFFVYKYHPRFSLVGLRMGIFNSLSVPVVLFDTHDMLVDYNNAAGSLFSIDRKMYGTMTISGFLSSRLCGQIRRRSAETAAEVTLDTDSGSRVFKLDYICLNSSKDHLHGTLLQFSDITELKQMYNTMKQTAMTDRLTGLASRMMLDRKISEINLYRKYPYCAAACSINGLQFIKNGFGEAAYDMVLVKFANILKQQLRAEDFAAYDDDIIVVLLPDLAEDTASGIFGQINGALQRENILPFRVMIEYKVVSRSDPDVPMQEIVDSARNGMMRKLLLRNSEVNKELVLSLSKALSDTGRETKEHAARVEELACRLGKVLRLTDEQMQNLSILAQFHDIGKQTVPAGILAKRQNNLTEKELEQKKLHAVTGYRLACSVPDLESVASDILCHHERWDGKGYPNGFKGEKIPYLARIFAVVDAFDALTHDRVDYKAVSEKSALETLLKGSGKQFDPQIVKIFVLLFSD